MNDEMAALIGRVDELEAAADGYLTLAEVERSTGFSTSQAIAEGVLLVDYRQRVDGTAVTLCRLNRHHPQVVQLTASG